MRILITGDKGFVGSATTALVKSHGHEVIGYDIMDRLDIRDKDRLKHIINEFQPDRILHLAAIARFSEADTNPKLAHETNVLGTMNVSHIAQLFHIPIVYASTGSVYMPIEEKPPITESFKACGNSTYGCTKYQGELYIKQENVPWIILRYAHLYGKEKRMHGLIGGFLERLERGLAPTLYGGKQSNDFTYIRDVARANYLALTAPWDKWNNVYNIGTGEEISAADAGKLVIEAYNKSNPKKPFKGKIETKVQRTVDPDRFVYDISKAEKQLGFKAEFSFKNGLQDMFTEFLLYEPSKITTTTSIKRGG